MCNENHTTLLHPVTLWPDKKNCASEHNVQTNNNPICTVNTSNALNSNDNGITENVALSNIADSGVKNVFMPIALVKVKSPVSNSACVTYALIDSGSDAIFCSENLLHKLNIEDDKTRLKLTTLQNANHVVDSQVVQNLRVSDVDKNYKIVVPDTFSRPQLNIDRSVIPIPADISKFDYLNCVYLPEIDSDVDLILGQNASNLFIPSTVTEPPKDKIKNGPYAVYKLGWVLSGSPAHNSNPLNHGALNNFFVQNDSTFCHSWSEIFKLTKNKTLELSSDQQSL